MTRVPDPKESLVGAERENAKGVASVVGLPMTTARKPARHLTVLLALALMTAGCTAEARTTTTPDAAQGPDRVGIPWIPCDDCAAIELSDGSLKAGRYIVNGPGFPGNERAGGWPEAVVVTVPGGGWHIASRQRGSGITFGELPTVGRLYMGSVANVAADPCSDDARVGSDVPQVLLDPPIGPTVDDLATALASTPGVLSTPPAHVTLAGFSGTHFTMTIDTPCEAFQLWVTPYSPELWGFNTFDGWQHLVWILDVDGLRFAIDASWGPETPAKLPGELLQMVNSLEIQP